MTSWLSTFSEKCSISFNNEVISDENIIKRYLSFLTDAIDRPEHTVGLAMHTGSICFDAISVLAAGIESLSYCRATTDDILNGLRYDDVVVFHGQRFCWMGTIEEDGRLYIKLSSGKNHMHRQMTPYDKSKYIIFPYYGNARRAGKHGTSVFHYTKRIATNRRDFLSCISGIPSCDIPVQADVSVIVVADRKSFADIYSGTTIEFQHRRIGLPNVFPASYFSSGGNEYIYGSNPLRTEPVFKVTDKLSVARDLVFDNMNANKPVGLLVFGDMLSGDESEANELQDILKTERLKFALVSSTLYSDISSRLIVLNGDAPVFACTGEYLSSIKHGVKSRNAYTEELSRQASAIIGNTVSTVRVDGGISSEAYLDVRKALLALRRSEWDDNQKANFIMAAYGILNLLNTAVFPMNEMESAAADGQIDERVESPKKRIEELLRLAEGAGSAQDLCLSVASALERQYNDMLDDAPKANALKEYICKLPSDASVAVIVPKAYYGGLMRRYMPDLFESYNIACLTPSRFDPQTEYEAVVAVGEMKNRNFNLERCFASERACVLLYECEEKIFAYSQRERNKYEDTLNKKLGIAAKCSAPAGVGEADESEMRDIASLDGYIDGCIRSNIKRTLARLAETDSKAPKSEITHIGKFTDGEQIFLSKYYSALVFDPEKGTVTEKKSPDELSAGDVLVFTKNDEYTKNIVDITYENLLKAGKLKDNDKSIVMYEKARYWKEALREYKDREELSYPELKKRFHQYGSKVAQTTVQKWLADESHIVGPQDESSLRYIAFLTQDPYLTNDIGGHFEAIQYIRQERRRILNHIAESIDVKLTGNMAAAGDSEYEAVYSNIEKLFETRELRDIVKLDKSEEVKASLANRPIEETEVIL